MSSSQEHVINGVSHLESGKNWFSLSGSPCLSLRLCFSTSDLLTGSYIAQGIRVFSEHSIEWGLMPGWLRCTVDICQSVTHTQFIPHPRGRSKLRGTTQGHFKERSNPVLLSFNAKHQHFQFKSAKLQKTLRKDSTYAVLCSTIQNASLPGSS